MFAHEFADNLQQDHIVRSSFMLRVILKLRGTSGKLVPGEYLFQKRESVFKIASRITKGDFQIEQKKVTIPEGSTNEQIAVLIKETFSDFDDKGFLSLASAKQGYLFPETYFFQSTSTKDILAILTDHFDLQVRDLQSDAINEGKEWSDIVTMASILEKEANNPTDYKLVAGILWKRLEIGMALQVDAAPITYDRPGFPPQPISNPGIAALEGALNPTKSDYLYYLTGKDGVMHYAVTFDQHKANVQKYLK